MAITAAELNVIVSAETSGATTALGNFSNRMKKFGDELQGIGARMSIGITAPLALMGAAIVKVGTDYEKSMNIFQSVTSASADQMARAAVVAKQLGADMQLPATSAGDAAKAMTELAKGGLTAEQAMEATRGTLQLAAAAMIDEARAAEITANALNAFGLSASEAGRISDLLAAAANASSAEIDDIALSMQQASAVFASASIPIEDLTAAIGLMANAGIKGSDAGTSLKTMIIALSAPTDKAAATMKQLGINIFDAQGEFIPFRGMIEQVSEALKGMSAEQQAAALKTIFGTDALRAANIVMAKGTDAFDEMSKAVQRAGAAQELAEARAKGLSGAVDGLVSQLETLALQIYESVAPGLEQMVRGLADLVGNLAQADKAVLQAGVVMAGVFAAAGPIALGIGVIVSLIGGPLTIAIVGLTAAVAILAAEWVLDMNKMGQAGAITAETTRDKFIELATTIGHVMDGLSFATNLVAAAIKDVAAIVFAALTPVIYLGLAITEGFSKAATIIKDTWSNLNASIARSNDAMSSALEGRWSTMLGNLVRGMSAAGQSIQRAWGETAALFGARSKIKWDAALTPDGDAQKKIKDAMRNVGNGAAAAFGEGTKGGGKKAIDAFANEVKEAMKAVTQAIEDGLLGGDKIGRVLAEKITPAVDTLKKKAAELATTIRAVGDAFNREMGTAIDSVTQKVIRGDGTFEALINRMIDLKRASETAARASKQEFEAFSDLFKDLSSQLPSSWNRIIDGILQGSGRLGTDLLKMGVKVKGFANDLLGVFDAMPGKVGDALRRTVDEVERWYRTIDGIIKLVQRVFGSDSPTGLGGILSGVIGIFKKTTAVIAESVPELGHSIGGSLAAAGASVGAEAVKTGTVIGKGVTSGIGDFLSSAAGITAAIAGAIGLSLSTFQSDSKYKRFLGSFALGGPIGGLLAVIFGGPSERQKAENEAAIAQYKADVVRYHQQSLQAVEETKQSMLDTAVRIRELLESITFYTKVPKEAFNAFFKDLDKVMKAFADRAKAWLGDSSGKIKVFAEDMKLIVEAIAAAPLALEGIGKYLGVPESSIAMFFNDLGKVLVAFEELSDDFTRKFLRGVRKFAERIEAAVGIIPDITAGIVGLVEIKPISVASLDIWEDALHQVVERMGTIAEFFDKHLVKAIGFFAEKVAPAVSLWKESIEAVRSMVDIPMPSEADFNNLFAGIRRALEGMSEIATTMSTEALGKAQSIATASLSIFASIKAGVEALSSLKDFGGVLEDTFTKFFDAFNHSVDMLIAMAGRALTFEQTAKTIEQYIMSGAASLAHVFEMLSQITTAAGSFFPSGTPTTPVPALASGGDIQSSGLAFLHAGERVVPASVVSGSQGAGAINLTVNVNAGTLVHQSSIPDFIVRGLIEAYKQGRISNSVFTGNLVTR